MHQRSKASELNDPRVRRLGNADMVLRRIRHRFSRWTGLGLRRDDGGGEGGVHQGRANPRALRLAYDAAAPLTEGRSMEAFQVVRARLQLGRGYATAAAGLRVAAQGETPRAQ